MIAVIKPVRWWWPPDRKKAKLMNIIQQKYINLKVQNELMLMGSGDTYHRYLQDKDGNVREVTL